MEIRAIAVGKLRDRAVAEWCERYAGRLPRAVKLSFVEVAAATGVGAKAREEEAARLLARRPQRAMTAALSERGDRLDSRAFAAWLAQVRDAGRPLCFLIGGADGLAPTALAAADRVLSLSPLTFPHELVRAILAEQLYRAFSILAGEPYHRD